MHIWVVRVGDFAWKEKELFRGMREEGAVSEALALRPTAGEDRPALCRVRAVLPAELVAPGKLVQSRQHGASGQWPAGGKVTEGKAKAEAEAGCPGPHRPG